MESPHLGLPSDPHQHSLHLLNVCVFPHPLPPHLYAKLWRVRRKLGSGRCPEPSYGANIKFKVTLYSKRLGLWHLEIPCMRNCLKTVVWWWQDRTGKPTSDVSRFRMWKEAFTFSQSVWGAGPGGSWRRPSRGGSNSGVDTRVSPSRNPGAHSDFQTLLKALNFSDSIPHLWNGNDILCLPYLSASSEVDIINIYWVPSTCQAL